MQADRITTGHIANPAERLSEHDRERTARAHVQTDRAGQSPTCASAHILGHHQALVDDGRRPDQSVREAHQQERRVSGGLGQRGSGDQQQRGAAQEYAATSDVKSVGERGQRETGEQIAGGQNGHAEGSIAATELTHGVLKPNNAWSAMHIDRYLYTR